MDLAAIILGVLAVNVITFLGGCALAIRRYRREQADGRIGISSPPARRSSPS